MESAARGERSAAATLFSDVRAIARWLLAGDPDSAGRLLAAEEVDLSQLLSEGRAVVSFSSSTDTAYVVVDHGTATTRAELPTWAVPEDVHLVELPDRRDRAWEALAARAGELEARYPTLYSELEVERMLSAVRTHLFEDAAVSLAACGALVAVPKDRLATVIADNDQAREWLSEAIRVLVGEVLACRIPLESAQAAAATLVLIQLSSAPSRALAVGVLRTVAFDLGPAEVSEVAGRPEQVLARAEHFPLPLERFSLLLHPGFYASELAISGYDGLVTALQVASRLRRVGDWAITDARRKTSVELFHAGLQGGLLQFGAAANVLAELDPLVQGSSPQLMNDRVHCEERRVTILGALYHASGLGARLNPRSFTSIGSFVNHLAGAPINASRAEVNDLALRLVIPSFMRELLLGSIWRLNGDFESARIALERTYELLERGRDVNAGVTGEPAFVVPVARELAQVYDALGRKVDADRLRERAEVEVASSY